MIINPYRFSGGAAKYSRDFDGIDDKVTIAVDPVDVAPLTMAAWVKMDTTTQVGGIWNIEGDTGASNNAGFGLLIVNGVLWAYTQTTGAFDYAASTSTLNTTEWWHVCGVFRSSKDREIYINGTSEGTNTTNITPSTIDVDNACIGNRANTNTDQDFSGKIADVRVYNADIGETEIANLAAGTDYQTNLVGHWITGDDEGSGSVTVVDQSTNSNDGTSVGSLSVADYPPI